MYITIPEFVPEIKPEWKCPPLIFEGLTVRQGILLCDSLENIRTIKLGVCLAVEDHLRGDAQENYETIEAFTEAMRDSPVGDGFLTHYWKSTGGYDYRANSHWGLAQEIRLQWVKHILKHLRGPVADEVNRYR